MISYTCPRCQSTMTSPDEMVGKLDKCPECGTRTVVPHYRPPVARPQPAGKPGKFSPIMNIVDRRANPARTAGLAGAGLGAMACLTIWYPIPYAPTWLLGILALLFAGLSNFASRKSWKKNVVLPSASAVLGLTAITLAIFYNPNPVETKEPGPEPAKKNTPAPRRGVDPTAPLPIGMARRWQNRSIAVVSAQVGNVRLTSGTAIHVSQAKFLMITIEAKNTAAGPGQHQHITYTTLRGNPSSEERTFASLSDAKKRFYKRVNFGVGLYPVGSVSLSAPLAPGKSVRDIVVFQRPAAAEGPFRIHIPLGNLGGRGFAVWEIPKSALR